MPQQDSSSYRECRQLAVQIQNSDGCDYVEQRLGIVSPRNLSIKEERCRKDVFILTALSYGVGDRGFPSTRYASQQKYVGCLRVGRLDPGPERFEKYCPSTPQIDWGRKRRLQL
jgi:hypothetical protein